MTLCLVFSGIETNNEQRAYKICNWSTFSSNSADMVYNIEKPQVHCVIWKSDEINTVF